MASSNTAIITVVVPAVVIKYCNHINLYSLLLVLFSSYHGIFFYIMFLKIFSTFKNGKNDLQPLGQIIQFHTNNVCVWGKQTISGTNKKLSPNQNNKNRRVANTKLNEDFKGGLYASTINIMFCFNSDTQVHWEIGI